MVWIISRGITFLNQVQAKTSNYEVRKSGSNYIWRFNGTDEGSTTNFTTVLIGAIDTGNRTVHVLYDGTLSGQVRQVSYLTIDYHDNTITGGNFYRDGGTDISFQNMNAM